MSAVQRACCVQGCLAWLVCSMLLQLIKHLVSLRVVTHLISLPLLIHPKPPGLVMLPCHAATSTCRCCLNSVVDYLCDTEAATHCHRTTS